MKIDTGNHRAPLISLTPLIDVVFILLIFFMLATRFGDWRDLPMDVTPAGESVPSHETLHRLHVLDGQRVELNGEPLATEELARALAPLRGEALWISGGDEATLQALLQVADRVRASGFTDAQLELLR